ncbi:MAG: class I SAM-dependent methyltransferase [Methanomicrobiales archaeon]|nr:class I SAM-dependent methyltransferase [Methanomicrobiales archaeon]
MKPMMHIPPTENSRNWTEFWQQAVGQKTKGGPMQAGFWDSRAGQFAKKPAGREEDRLFGVLDLIGQTGLVTEGASVLDIGAGTGALAIPLAKRGARVTAVDFSAEMLRHLTNRAAEEKAVIEQTVHLSWDEIDLDDLGFRKNFDLVIASMTPAVQTPQTFGLMLEAAKGVCYYSGWIDRRWDPAYHELYRMLFNEEFRQTSHGFPYPFMYLYLNGYRPIVRIRQDVWKGDETVEEMVDTVAGFFSATKEIDASMKERMWDYFTARATEGKYSSQTTATTGTMVWDMRKRERPGT